MVAKLNWKRRTAALLLCALAPAISSCVGPADSSDDENEIVTQTSQASTTSMNMSPELQQELTQLTYCYAAGTDLAGTGDQQGAVQEYSNCYASNAVSEYLF